MEWAGRAVPQFSADGLRGVGIGFLAVVLGGFGELQPLEENIVTLVVVLVIFVLGEVVHLFGVAAVVEDGGCALEGEGDHHDVPAQHHRAPLKRSAPLARIHFLYYIAAVSYTA